MQYLLIQAANNLIKLYNYFFSTKTDVQNIFINTNTLNIHILVNYT